MVLISMRDLERAYCQGCEAEACDWHCARCGAEVYSPDVPSVAIWQWEPVRGHNNQRRLYCARHAAELLDLLSEAGW